MDLNQMMRAPLFHQWLGVELVSAQNGAATVRLPYRDDFLGDEAGSNIHGGIISTLADIAACFAVISATGHDVPTLDLRVDYLRLAPRGATLVAVAKTVKAGRTIGVADVEVHSEDEQRLIAVARGTFYTRAPRNAIQ